MTTRPQFIAGAVCPNCQQTDSLMLDKSQQEIRCVTCDFVETSQQRDRKAEQKNEQTPIQIINLDD